MTGFCELCKFKFHCEAPSRDPFWNTEPHSRPEEEVPEAWEDVCNGVRIFVPSTEYLELFPLILSTERGLRDIFRGANRKPKGNCFWSIVGYFYPRIPRDIAFRMHSIITEPLPPLHS